MLITLADFLAQRDYFRLILTTLTLFAYLSLDDIEPVARNRRLDSAEAVAASETAEAVKAS